MDDNKCEQCQESLKEPCYPVSKTWKPNHLANRITSAKRKKYLLKISHLSNVTEALYYAIKHQHIKCYSMYLDKGASINATLNFTGHTALHIAVIVRNKEIIMDLLSRCADWTATDVNGANILHIAIEYYISEAMNIHVINSNLNSKCDSDNMQQEIIEILTIFLDLGLAVDSKDCHCRTPLSVALEAKMRKVAEFLIDRGADVNHCDDQGNTLLHRLVTFAKEKKNSTQVSHYARLVIFLVSKGANVDSTNNDGCSVLDLAIKYNLKDITFILLQCVNNVNLKLTKATKNKTTLHIYVDLICQKKIHKLAKKYGLQGNFDMYSIIERMIEKGVSVDVADETVNSPLHVAMNFEDEKLILLLLKYSTNVNEFNSDGDTLLHVFLNNYNKNRNIGLNILFELLRRGADVNKHNKAGLTAIQVAITHNFVEIFRILKDKSDFNVLTGNGESMIHLASKTSELNSEIIDHLLMQGFDLIAPNEDGLTAIHLAAHSGNIQMIGILLRQGIDVNCREKHQQRTPIHMAAEASNDRTSVKTIEFLVQNGADINAKDANDETALLKIDFQKMNYIALLKLGADIHAEDKNGRNLLHRAMSSNEMFIARLLYNLGVKINLKNCSRDERDKRVELWFKHKLEGTLSYEHIVKLELADLPVPEIFHPFVGPYGPAKICDNDAIKQNLLFETLRDTRSKCERDCPSEIEKMKTFLLNDTMSIYDFMHLTPNRQLHEVDNEILANLVWISSNIANIFPNYCGIIRAIYNEALEKNTRRLLKEKASPILRQLSNCPIPDLCTELIFNHFSDQDLDHIIMSLK